MTGFDLKHIRLERGLTQRALAEFLGDVSPSALSLWERDESFVVPAWITQKLLPTTITLPLTELEEMLDHARAHGLSFAELLAAATREYLATRAAVPGVPWQIVELHDARVADAPPSE